MKLRRTGRRERKNKGSLGVESHGRGLQIKFLTATATLSCVPVLPPSRFHTDAELWSTRLKWGNVMVGNGRALICRPLRI